MSFFETREQRELRLKKEEAAQQEKWRQEAMAEKERKENEKQKEQEAFLNELKHKIKMQAVITLALCGKDADELKELAMNWLLDADYKCVQNDVQCTRYCVHYELTFVRTEKADFFITCH